jgi:hypothetical protein
MEENKTPADEAAERLKEVQEEQERDEKAKRLAFGFVMGNLTYEEYRDMSEIWKRRYRRRWRGRGRPEHAKGRPLSPAELQARQKAKRKKRQKRKESNRARAVMYDRRK